VPPRRPREAPLILVVDDEEGVRQFAAAVLRDAGYRVLEAEDGQRAIMLFEDNPDINLIFTDIVMPGLDGFKLADMTTFKRPNLRILYATASSRRRARSSASSTARSSSSHIAPRSSSSRSKTRCAEGAGARPVGPARIPA